MTVLASKLRRATLSGLSMDNDPAAGPPARSDEYWDTFYRRQAVPTRASPFAAFVHDAVAADASVLVDVGCGNGRDSFFFAASGVPTIGVDASAGAIDLCRTHVPSPSLPITFVHSSVDSADVLDRLRDEIARMRRSQGPLVIYARFFLHAISQSSESVFLGLASRLLSDMDGVLAVEFRTMRDKDRPKLTGSHFRRYVDPRRAIETAGAHGMRLDFFVEGLGYARYKGEDAHVARCLFVK